VPALGIGLRDRLWDAVDDVERRAMNVTGDHAQGARNSRRVIILLR